MPRDEENQREGFSRQKNGSDGRSPLCGKNLRGGTTGVDGDVGEPRERSAPSPTGGVLNQFDDFDVNSWGRKFLNLDDDTGIASQQRRSAHSQKQFMGETAVSLLSNQCEGSSSKSISNGTAQANNGKVPPGLDESISAGSKGSKSSYELQYSALEANFLLAKAQTQVGQSNSFEPHSHDVGRRKHAMTNTEAQDGPHHVILPTNHTRNKHESVPEFETPHSSIKRSRGPNTVSDRVTAGSQSKNEREQKRAQKISDIIEQIRMEMEEDGRQLEIRSKFSILSNAVQYLREITETAAVKEQSITELKNELEGLQSQLEETRVNQRSDFDSVTSSLTSSSATKSDNPLGTQGNSKGSTHINHAANSDARKQTHIVSYVDPSTSGGSSGSARNSDDTREPSPPKEKDIVGGSTTNSDRTNPVSEGKATTSGSDASKKVELVPVRDSKSGGDSVAANSGVMGIPTTNSFVSDAAVKSQSSTRVISSTNTSSNTQEKDSNTSESSTRKVPPVQEVVAFERPLEVKFESVFLESNVPQVIADFAGRIVAYNRVFLGMTGLRKGDISKNPLYSLIVPDHLPELFQMLARFPNATVSGKREEPSSAAGEQNLRFLGSVTLPCVKFPVKRKQKTYQSPNPPFVMVVFLGNGSPRKYRVHGVFSYSRGDNGKVGIIPPELLEKLFMTHPYRVKWKKPEATDSDHNIRVATSQHRGMEVSFRSKRRRSPPSPPPPPPPPFEETNDDDA